MLALRDYHSQLDEALNINNVNSVFSELYYTDIINEKRVLTIRNEYNRNRSIDPNIIQTIGCQDMEQVSPVECCEVVDLPSDCKLLRTSVQIPNTIEFHDKKGISSVGPIDISKKRFTALNFSALPYAGNGRVNKNSTFWFLYNRYIYLYSKDLNVQLIEKINIRGLFENPIELEEFNQCDGSPCWTPDDKYPLNEWMWAYIKPMIVQELMQKQVIPLDDQNDNKDNKTELNAGAPQGK